MLKKLKELGLSKGEIKVYSALLELGMSTINAITEKTGLERRGIYDILNKLIEKGLIGYNIEKGVKTFRCAHPSKLLNKIENKEKALRKLKKQIPEFTEIFEEKKPRVTAEVFRGKEGIKAVFEDMLNYKENYFIGGGYYVMDLLPYYWPQYNKRRIKLGVKWYSLAKHELKKRKIIERRLYKTKFLPKEFSGDPSVVFIYGNKVANVLWDEGFFAFVIESKGIAEGYKKYFKYIWKKN